MVTLAVPSTPFSGGEAANDDGEHRATIHELRGMVLMLAARVAALERTMTGSNDGGQGRKLGLLSRKGIERMDEFRGDEEGVR